MKVKFWGVRGSVPTPLTHHDVATKIREFIHSLPDDATKWDYIKKLGDQWAYGVFAYGGNTSCVQIVATDGTALVLDAGTGIRVLGDDLMDRLLERRKAKGTAGLSLTFLFSHEHHDHLQGIPFFAPLYLKKDDGWLNEFVFVGGTKWFHEVENCLRGQMDPPHFPVSWKEIEELTHKMSYQHVHDGLGLHVGPESGGLDAVARKLDHPQDTYGYRLTDPSTGKVLVYATDHEPRHPQEPHENLLRLSMDADVLITDCQYSDHQYCGKGKGPKRFSWGHSYPEAVAHTAVQAKVKQVVLFHHDPGSTDADIESIVASVRDHIERIKPSGLVVEVTAAYEGLILEV